MTRIRRSRDRHRLNQSCTGRADPCSPLKFQSTTSPRTSRDPSQPASHDPRASPWQGDVSTCHRHRGLGCTEDRPGQWWARRRSTTKLRAGDRRAEPHCLCPGASLLTSLMRNRTSACQYPNRTVGSSRAPQPKRTLLQPFDGFRRSIQRRRSRPSSGTSRTKIFPMSPSYPKSTFLTTNRCGLASTIWTEIGSARPSSVSNHRSAR